MKRVTILMLLLSASIGWNATDALADHTTCANVQETCSGANVFLTCIHEDGTSEQYPMLAGGGGSGVEVTNMNTMVLAYMTAKAAKKKTPLVLGLDYAPTGGALPNQISAVSLQ